MKITKMEVEDIVGDYESGSFRMLVYSTGQVDYSWKEKDNNKLIWKHYTETGNEFIYKFEEIIKNIRGNCPLLAILVDNLLEYMDDNNDIN